jgi:hypothetical protein
MTSCACTRALVIRGAVAHANKGEGRPASAMPTAVIDGIVTRYEVVGSGLRGVRL